jgi:hypothetical protein
LLSQLNPLLLRVSVPPGGLVLLLLPALALLLLRLLLLSLLNPLLLRLSIPLGGLVLLLLPALPLLLRLLLLRLLNTLLRRLSIPLWRLVLLLLPALPLLLLLNLLGPLLLISLLVLLLLSARLRLLCLSLRVLLLCRWRRTFLLPAALPFDSTLFFVRLVLLCVHGHNRSEKQEQGGGTGSSNELHNNGLLTRLLLGMHAGDQFALALFTPNSPVILCARPTRVVDCTVSTSCSHRKS